MELPFPDSHTSLLTLASITPVAVACSIPNDFPFVTQGDEPVALSLTLSNPEFDGVAICFLNGVGLICLGCCRSAHFANALIECAALMGVVAGSQGSSKDVIKETFLI